MKLRRLLLVSFVSILAAGCGTKTETVTRVSPPPRVFVPVHGQLEYEPDVIGVGESSGIEQIRWTSYGGATAVGVGVFPKSDCDPNCADGHITEVRVTVKLTRRIPCRGVLAYDLMAIQGPGFDGAFDPISIDTDC